MNNKKLPLNLNKKVIKQLDSKMLSQLVTNKIAGGSNSYNGPCYTPATSQRYC